jgi:hypothetical protein
MLLQPHYHTAYAHDLWRQLEQRHPSPPRLHLHARSADAARTESSCVRQLDRARALRPALLACFTPSELSAAVD